MWTQKLERILSKSSGELVERAIRGWGLSRQGGFSGSEQLGAGEQLTYLIEHEGVEFVSSHAPLGAAVVGTTRAPGITVGA